MQSWNHMELCFQDEQNGKPAAEVFCCRFLFITYSNQDIAATVDSQY